MFDVSWSEMAIIGVVTLIVVGPKDLPKVMRGVARLTAQARGLASEFRRGLDDIAREAEFSDLERKLEELKTAQMKAVLGEAPPVTPDDMHPPPPDAAPDRSPDAPAGTDNASADSVKGAAS